MNIFLLRMNQAENNRYLSEEEELKAVENAYSMGDARQVTKFAWFLLTGRGGSQVDEDRAVALLEERVKDRDAKAMWMLGTCYEFGIGTERDVFRAKNLYNESSAQGDSIGKMLSNKGHCKRSWAKPQMRRLSEILEVDDTIHEIQSVMIGEYSSMLDSVLSIAPWTTLCLCGMYEYMQIGVLDQAMMNRYSNKRSR